MRNSDLPVPWGEGQGVRVEADKSWWDLTECVHLVQGGRALAHHQQWQEHHKTPTDSHCLFGPVLLTELYCAVSGRYWILKREISCTKTTTTTAAYMRGVSFPLSCVVACVVVGQLVRPGAGLLALLVILTPLFRSYVYRCSCVGCQCRGAGHEGSVAPPGVASRMHSGPDHQLQKVWWPLYSAVLSRPRRPRHAP
jgi:hypothetical protein